MNSMSRIIDDRGAWWNATDRGLRAALHLEDIRGDVRPVLIGNLGFIGVSCREPGVIVRFRPRTVSRAALGALFYWLARRGRERICLSVLLDGRHERHEILPSARAALLRMEALIELELGSSALPSFVARAGTLREMDRGSCFSVLFEHWRTAGGIFDEEAYRPLLARSADERYVLFEPCPGGLGFNIVRAGAGLRIPDKASHRALNGLRLENVADRAYAQWTAGFYRAALDSRQPLYDHIKAAIRWPRSGRIERQYSRLILPCVTKGGRPMLLGISGNLAAPGGHLEAA